MSGVTVTVRLFAMLRERAGRDAPTYPRRARLREVRPLDDSLESLFRELVR